MKKIVLVLTLLLFSISQNILAETYDLSQFLDLVQKNNKDLKLAQKELDVAKATKKEAISTALPTIMAEAGYKRNLLDYYMYADLGALTGAGGTAKFKINRDNEYSAQAVLSQTLFSPKVGNAIKAAKQYQKLTDYVYDASQQNIFTFAKKGFYQALLLKEVWQVTESAKENAYDNYMNVKMKFDNGLVSEFQLLQAETRWKNQIPQSTEAKRNYEIALVNLKNLAGIPVENELLLQGDLSQYPLMPEVTALETILKERPDYNALLWEEQLRKTNVSAEKASFFPTLTGNVIATYSSQANRWALDEKNHNYILGLNLSMPIFTGGYRSAQVQKAKIEVDKNRIKIDQTKENIYREIKNVRLRLKEAYDRILSAESTLKTAEKAFHIAETTAKSGLATQLELKDTRVVYDQARINYNAAIFDYLIAYFDWELAIGNVK